MLEPSAMTQPILQFGTSRFLQAHVDLFVSQALARGQALGGITVVQTTHNPASAQRVAALAQGAGYPVHLRGLLRGERIDSTVTCNAVRQRLRDEQVHMRLQEAAGAELEYGLVHGANTPRWP